MQPPTWRLLLQPQPQNGAANMALDESLLQAAREPTTLPTLRLYAWQPALSLGRGQPITDINTAALEMHHYGLVRRPSGGQAVFNHDQLSYAIVGHESHPAFAGGIIAAYRNFSAALLHMVRELGLPAKFAERSSPPPPEIATVCFAATADYEILVSGRKIVGHAQLRRGGAVLLHGAVPLNSDIARICPLLTRPPDPQALRDRATSLGRELGRSVTWDEAAAALLAGFRTALQLPLEPGTLSAQEQLQTDLLIQEKYVTPEWTRKVDSRQ